VIKENKVWHFRRLTLLGLGLAATLNTTQSHAQQDTFAVCASINDDAVRLACFDAAVKASQVNPQPQQPAANTAPRRVVEDAPAESTPSSRVVENVAPGPAPAPAQEENPAEVATSQENFGLEHKIEQEADAPVALEVASASHNKLTGWTIEFSNGQVWRQVGTNKFDIQVGNTYQISRASLNSFMLGSTESRRQIRVTRVR
jgi:hypothetical protein